MKRCPQCYERYENTAMFCEADGQRLLDDPAVIVNDGDLVPYTPSKPTQTYLLIGLIGALTGVLLCGVAYLGYSLLQPPPDPAEREKTPLAQQFREPAQSRPAPVRAVEPEPSPSESPSPSPETVASPEPSQQPQADVVSARLNRGPISTAKQPEDNDGGKTKTIIEMQDGSVIEVDAAWKDSQGVWYRRGGLVSFVESPRVKAITARAEPKTSPASNQ